MDEPLNAETVQSKKPMPEKDADGNPIITMKYLQDICEFEGGYRVPHLNEILYLNMQGFSKIENLEEFYNVKSLFFDGNRLEAIEGISHMHNLASLYLYNNLITRITGLENCKQLHTLNLSNNLISVIEGMQDLKALTRLDISANRLAGPSSIEQLKFNPALEMLIIKDNNLDCSDDLDSILASLSLTFLELKGNPIVRNTPNYRKKMFERLPTLICLEGEHRDPKVPLVVELDNKQLDPDRVERNMQRWRGAAREKEMDRARMWREELAKAQVELQKLRSLHLKLQDEISKRKTKGENEQEDSIEELQAKMALMIKDDKVSPEEKSLFKRHLDDRIMRHKLGIEPESPIEMNETTQEWAEDRINECIRNIEACEAQARVFDSHKPQNPMFAIEELPEAAQSAEQLTKPAPQQRNIEEIMEEKIAWSADLDDDLESILIGSAFNFDAAVQRFNLRLDERKRAEGRRVVHQSRGDLMKRWTEVEASRRSRRAAHC